MISRIGEVILTGIGAFVYLIGAAFGGSLILINNSQEIMNEILAESMQGVSAEEQQAVELVMNSMGTFGTIITIIAVVCVILGIVAMFMFRNNKKPKPASIILIVVGGLTTLVTFGFAIFAGIFYIIAGIMGLVRKPKTESVEVSY
ncbi:DUF4064 domain-containing protein [Gracilibacillus marinus]|jgi:uncharacterized membrane protein (UPF0136 family)|uniref:DUF4064 domain-containing protein n=1 Tax=Gracilibacillus marinus TaxID=630535 RepID=A0ABV8VUD6_9BACI